MAPKKAGMPTLVHVSFQLAEVGMAGSLEI